MSIASETYAQIVRNQGDRAKYNAESARLIVEYISGGLTMGPYHIRDLLVRGATLEGVAEVLREQGFIVELPPDLFMLDVTVPAPEAPNE
jgi:hypothetical protein